MGVDSSTMAANASLRAIVRRDTGERYGGCWRGWRRRRARDDLVAMRDQESNRAGLNSTSVEKSIALSLASIDQWIEEIDREIKEHINRYPDLKKRFDLLRSIPGIGPVGAEVQPEHIVYI